MTRIMKCVNFHWPVDKTKEQVGPSIHLSIHIANKCVLIFNKYVLLYKSEEDVVLLPLQEEGVSHLGLLYTVV
jgi:hypothetical protein